MTGNRFKAIRKRLGLTQTEMAIALGYEGAPSTLQPYIAGMEGGIKGIPPLVSRVMLLLETAGEVPDKFFKRQL